MPVIDLLEVVEVDHDHAAVLAGARGTVQLALTRLEECPPVRQACE
jgi:hypothetical protein